MRRCPICDGDGSLCNLPYNEDCYIRDSDSIECPDDCEHIVDCYFCQGSGEVVNYNRYLATEYISLIKHGHRYGIDVGDPPPKFYWLVPCILELSLFALGILTGYRLWEWGI